MGLAGFCSEKWCFSDDVGHVFETQIHCGNKDFRASSFDEAGSRILEVSSVCVINVRISLTVSLSARSLKIKIRVKNYSNRSQFEV